MYIICNPYGVRADKLNSLGCVFRIHADIFFFFFS